MNEETLALASMRAAEIREQGETHLFLLRPENREGEKQEIMVAARDIITARSLVPVIEALLLRGYPVSILADQPAEGYLRSAFKDRDLEELQPKIESDMLEEVSPLAAIGERNPALMISDMSATGGPAVEFYATETAEGYGEGETNKIPTVWIESFWGAATRDYQLGFNVRPDVICAFDQESLEMDLAKLKERGITDITPEQFVVTGSPVFDELAHEEDRDEVTERVRGALGVGQGDFMVAYMGSTPPEDLLSLEHFINSLNNIDTQGKQLKIAARIHPSVFREGPLSLYKEQYEQLLGTITQGEVLDTMGKFTTDEIAKATDMVVSEYSTEGIKAVYRGKISLFMLLPELGAAGLKASVGMDTLPVIESGAAIGVFDQMKLTESLQGALNPEVQKQLRQAQQAGYHLDGKNTERIVGVIESQLSKDKES